MSKITSVNESTISLSSLTSGHKFRIKKVRASGEIRKRLIDMGFIRGEKGQIIREALLKDPIELDIKGTKVSLRRSEASLIDIEVIY